MTYLKDKRNKPIQLESAQVEPKKPTKGKPEYVEGEEAAQNFERLAKNIFSIKKMKSSN